MTLLLFRLIVLRAVVYIMLAGGFSITPISLASPVLRPVASAASVYTPKSSSWNGNSRHSLDNSLVTRIPQILTASDLGERTLPVTQKRLEDAHRSVVGCYQDAVVSSKELHKLSGRSFGTEDAIVGRLTDYKACLLCIASGLDYLGRDKGLANYDPSDGLEVMLRKLVDLHKDTLTSVDSAVSSIPALGPILKPIVYEIKCTLDDLLNAVENLSDLILNSLSPLLTECIRITLLLACKFGLGVLGICL